MKKVLAATGTITVLAGALFFGAYYGTPAHVSDNGHN
jgi:hypothetical protein